MRRTDGRTDMTKLLVAFRDFRNAPKTCIFPQMFLLKFENKFILSTRNKPVFIVMVSSTFSLSPVTLVRVLIQVLQAERVFTVRSKL